MRVNLDEFKSRVHKKKWASLGARGIREPKSKEENEDRLREGRGEHKRER